MEAEKRTVKQGTTFDEFGTHWEEQANSFEDMGLKIDFLRGIFGYGFERPSDLQGRAIIPITNGRDLFVRSQSGTGKTALYAIGVLQRIVPEEPNTQVLILLPTRDWAESVNQVIQVMGQYLNIRSHALTGSAHDKKVLPIGVHIVLGTPGRIAYHIENKTIKTQHLRTLVIDEADELASLGFLDSLKSVVASIPVEAQICMLSSSITKETEQLATLILQNPVKILMKREDRTLQGICQYYFECKDDEHKIEAILECFRTIDVTQAVIYVNTDTKCTYVNEKLRQHELSISAVKVNQTQEERTKSLHEFMSGSSRILVSTDQFESQINPVSLVFNFELPHQKEQYICRVGRSGCYGRKGTAVNLVNLEEKTLLQDLREYYSTQIIPLPEDLSELRI